VRLSRYSIIGIMVALLLSAVAIMPVFGATTGTVSVSKTFVSPLGVATITVDDADLNVLITAAATETFGNVAAGSSVFFSLQDTAGMQGAAFATATGSADGDEISGTPTITAVSGGTSAANYSVGVFNAATGSIQVSANVTTTDTPVLNFAYKLATINTTSVDVTSPSDTTGVTVVLAESGADTGKFEGRFKVGTTNNDVAGAVSATAAIGILDQVIAVAGQSITVKYTDADPSVATETSVTVESTKPSGSLISPADGSETTSLAPKLTVEFVDVDSGVDSGTIAFALTYATITGDTSVLSDLSLGTPTITTITNGIRAEVTLTIGVTQADKTLGIRWNATLSDKAGNEGSAGSSDFALVVDQQGPNFAGATASAGAWWDAANSAVEDDEEKSVNTSIGIQLPDALDISGTAYDLDETLDAATVTAADFEVDTLKTADGVTSSDVTPSAAVVYAGAPNWIFLTVPAMAPDAKPKVNLLDTTGIADTAGNKTSTGSPVASDKQAPTVTVTLDKALDDEGATISITTNEAGAPPTVTISNSAGTDTAQTTPTLIGTNSYELEVEPGDGVNSIKVVVADANGNSVTKGTSAATTAKDFPEATSIVLYVDDSLTAPVITLNNDPAGTGHETSNPFFITADYTTEGAEYGLDASGAMTITAATVSTDLDVHNTVTISTVTLDDVSKLALVDTQDNITFNIAITDIAVGDHELVIVAEDQAGNETSTGTIEFTVVARKSYKVGVSAGWNLVSFPGDPADGSISSVFPATHPATDVLEFDDGVWNLMHRDSPAVAWESSSGTAMTIDGKHGYWVNTSSSEPMEALLALPSVGSAATLPTISVEAGWNLVSVIDLAQTKQPSTAITGAAYFTSIDWAVAYTYSSSTRTWTRITDTTSANLSNGQGVWVWANKAGTLIP